MSSLRYPSSKALSSRFAPAVLALWALACSEAATSPVGPADTTELDGVAGVSATEKAVTVPFRATYIIRAQLLLPGQPGYPARCPTGPTNAAGPAMGEGHATHLGRVMETENTCIDFATLQLTLGEFTFTAANGDQLSGTFEGSASFDPPPPNANLFCTWEITGGTGRFVGATGDGVCVDSRQLGDGRSLIGFDGWITYDASNRAAD